VADPTSDCPVCAAMQRRITLPEGTNTELLNHITGWKTEHRDGGQIHHPTNLDEDPGA
jgi:hypothetical protein